MSGSSNGQSVVLIVPNHTITGEVSLGEQRFSDFLNDTRSSFIEMYDAAFSHLSEPGKVISRSVRTTVPKDKVVIAFELAPEQRSRTQRFFSYPAKRKHSVFVATDDLEVQGVMHTMPTEAPSDVFMTERRFVPLTEAAITFCGLGHSRFKQVAVLVNVHDIQYVSETGNRET